MVKVFHRALWFPPDSHHSISAVGQAYNGNEQGTSTSISADILTGPISDSVFCQSQTNATHYKLFTPGTLPHLPQMA
jgi:hypothetical protein